MENLFVGLDPSLTATGLVILNKDVEIIHQELISTSSKVDIEPRLIKIKNYVMSSLNNVRRDKFYNVYVEGLSFMSSGQGFTQLAGLHYFLRSYFFQRPEDIKYKVIAPGSLKKFVTGKGNAKKELMLLKVFKKWGVEFSDNNLCDAYSLARMALEEYKETTNETQT